MAAKGVAEALSAFGAASKAKLANPAVIGAPENQLRSPLETLIRELAEIVGFPAGAVNLVGETTLAHLQTRPDFAITVQGAPVGFHEVKAPGKRRRPAQVHRSS